MTPPPVLRCYADSGTDWVIAFSPEDADAVWREHVGEDHTDDENGPWTECPPDRVLRINDDSGGARTLTIAEWIAECGRCFLCSENY